MTLKRSVWHASRKSMLEDKIDFLVEQWTLEEILEEAGLTAHEVLSILIRGGHMDLPEWVKDREFEGMYNGQDEET